MGAAYLLVSFAAIIRVFGPAVFPERYDEIVAATGVTPMRCAATLVLHVVIEERE